MKMCVHANKGVARGVHRSLHASGVVRTSIQKIDLNVEHLFYLSVPVTTIGDLYRRYSVLETELGVY